MRVVLVGAGLAALLAISLTACEPLPPPDEPGPVAGQMCGGLQGLACGSGAYCDYPVEARCGAADQTGMCRPVPEACTMQYDPVCGCDGKTYGNACSAASAGVSVVARGECS